MEHIGGECRAAYLGPPLERPYRALASDKTRKITAICDFNELRVRVDRRESIESRPSVKRLNMREATADNKRIRTFLRTHYERLKFFCFHFPGLSPLKVLTTVLFEGHASL